MSPFLDIPKRSEEEVRTARAIVPEQNWRERFEDGEIVETALTHRDQMVANHFSNGGTFQDLPRRQREGRTGMDVIAELFPDTNGLK